MQQGQLPVENVFENESIAGDDDNPLSFPTGLFAQVMLPARAQQDLLHQDNVDEVSTIS